MTEAEQRNDLKNMSIEELVTGLMETVCDKICRFPCSVQQDELEEKCEECCLACYVFALLEK